MGHRPSEQPPSPGGPLARRRRLARALLSALAGGGLTAAGLGGPTVENALAAGPRASAEGFPGSSGSAPSSTSQEGQGATGTTQPTTGTTTTPTTTTTTSSPPAGEGSPQPTSTSTTTTPSKAPEAPHVVVQRKQQASSGAQNPASGRSNQSKASKRKGKQAKGVAGVTGVAAPPQSVADTAALEAILNSSDASAAALNFYRVPLFLLPIYKAAAVQYGVPWPILAAINEIETDYGTDLSVSTAGAVGWMQFMPGTWLQYGVDALDAGYADPYNPVDAVFAAARYLRAAGAATNLKAAILAYNHSEEYVSSVLLRAKLISTYPRGVIATLTGLIDGRVPVTGKQFTWSTPEGSEGSSSPSSSSSATANATHVGAGAGTQGSGTANGQSQAGQTATAGSPATPGSSAPPSPAAAGSGASTARPLQLAELSTSPQAKVVAVQDGRVVGLGASRKLGLYVILRDVYGDVFTYTGLGSIAPSYTTPKPSGVARAAVEAASTKAPTPKGAASAGTQPLTLSVKTPQPPDPTEGAHSGKVAIAAVPPAGVPAGMDRARLYAHPNNPDARAAVAAKAAQRALEARAGNRQPLRTGSVVAAGTVLGAVTVSSEGGSGHLRFAVQPAGDANTIDPGPVLSNWAQLQSALHPEGARASNPLLGATASDVLLLSRTQLQRAVLSDPEISIYGCGRRDIASGLIDRRVLGVIAFLARSGLEPTVNALRCGQPEYTSGGSLSSAYKGQLVGISAINGVPIAHHQGAGTITDLAIRTLLTLPSPFVPDEILSLMRYPGARSTHAQGAFWNEIQLVFGAQAPAAPANNTRASSARAAGAGSPPRLPALGGGGLSSAQWNRLMSRVGTLPFPTVPTKPSSFAIADPRRGG
jgi:hypothetical protein